jgi:hypothetical protein
MKPSYQRIVRILRDGGVLSPGYGKNYDLKGPVLCVNGVWKRKWLGEVRQKTVEGMRAEELLDQQLRLKTS